MTKERLKYLLGSGILQAAVDGKALQYRTCERASWFDIEGFPDFDSPVEFRIKPKLNVPKVVRFGDLDQDTKFKYTEWCVIHSNGTGDIVPTRYSDGECQIDDNDTVVLLA